jgi:hypothetical protein
VAKPRNQWATLFIQGPPVATESLPLFLKADDPHAASRTIPLYVWGNYGSAVRSHTTLYIKNTDSPPNEWMGLFIAGGTPRTTETGTPLESMNLFIEGQHHYSINTIPLVVCNLLSGVAGSLTLAIRGPGEHPGYTPAGENMPLFMSCGPIGDNLPPVPHGVGLTAPLIIVGGPNGIGYADLFIEGLDDKVVQTLDMYIGGGVGTSMDSDITLVMPETYGTIRSVVKLFIDGYHV